MLAELDAALYRQYLTTNAHILDGENPHIKFKKVGFTVSTTTLEESDAEALQHYFPERDFVPLMEVLATVNRHTGWMEEFEHWQQRHHHGRPADRVVCAGVIGIGCTIGIRKMARISHPISESELENAVNWLIEPQRVRLFCDRKSAAAFLLATSPLSVPSPNPVSPIVVEAGACVEWDGLKVRIVHVGRTAITLQGEHDKPIEICHANWDALLKKGGVRPVRSEIRADEEIGDGPRMETAASHRIAQPPGIDTKPFRGAKRKLFSQTCPTELND